MSKQVPEPGNTSGRGNQNLKLVAQHQKMKMILGLVLRDKQVKKYNIYASNEDLKMMLRNLRVCMENIATHLMHVESHISYDSKGWEQLDPRSSRAWGLTNISCSKDVQYGINMVGYLEVFLAGYIEFYYSSLIHRHR